MRDNVPTEYSDYLADVADNGSVRSRDMLTFYPVDRGNGSIVMFSFWTDSRPPVGIEVYDGETGEVEERTVYGDDAIISVGETPNTNDLSIQRLSVSINPLNEVVKDMIRSYDMRNCRAELHRVLLDVTTNSPVSIVPCDFIGQVSLAPIDTPEAGGEAGVNLDIVSDLEDMNQTNYTKLSHETQLRRSPTDTIRQYSAELASGIQLPWGEKAIGKK